MGKYLPLQQYLEHRKSTSRECRLCFRKIEEIISDKLPPSAHNHREWWGNELSSSRVQARAWINAGWKVDMVNFEGEVVRFVVTE